VAEAAAVKLSFEALRNTDLELKVNGLSSSHNVIPQEAG
jgi:hypothetical protein